MSLSKARMRERKREDRNVKPKVVGVLEGVKPNSDGYYPAWAITNWYHFEGRVECILLPNCPDGRYR